MPAEMLNGSAMAELIQYIICSVKTPMVALADESHD
jgi:hypothetical protein